MNERMFKFKFGSNFMLSRGRELLAVFVLGLIVVAAIFIGWSQRAFASGSVVIDDRIEVGVEVASTVQAREKGLSKTDRLPSDRGMLFVFLRPDVYTFWMKDMKFPIDILWISGEELVDITTDIPMPQPGEELNTYFPRFPVDKVLEVSAGFAQNNGLRTGMKVVTHIDSGQASR
jgi:uncharacterized protein